MTEYVYGKRNMYMVNSNGIITVLVRTYLCMQFHCKVKTIRSHLRSQSIVQRGIFIAVYLFSKYYVLIFCYRYTKRITTRSAIFNFVCLRKVVRHCMHTKSNINRVIAFNRQGEEIVFRQGIFQRNDQLSYLFLRVRSQGLSNGYFRERL